MMPFAVLPVREFKDASPDAAKVMWLSIALWCLFRMINRMRLGDYLVVGAVTGLATATKYPAGAIMLGLLVAHLETQRLQDRSLLNAMLAPRFYLMALVAAIVLFCATPYVFLDWA